MGAAQQLFVDLGQAEVTHLALADKLGHRAHTREDEVFLLIKGTALVWCDDQEYELAEGGVVYLPRQIPHGYRITSKKADLLMINTPAGIEGMFRETGRDKSTPRPPGFQVKPDPALADKYGNIIVGPPH
jgi:hypothetical protein